MPPFLPKGACYTLYLSPIGFYVGDNFKVTWRDWYNTDVQSIAGENMDENMHPWRCGVTLAIRVVKTLCVNLMVILMFILTSIENVSSDSDHSLPHTPLWDK